MNTFYKRALFIVFAGLSSNQVIASDYVYKEDLVDGIAIRYIASQNAGDNEDKIMIQRYQANSPSSDKIKMNKISQPAIKYGEPLLIITAKNLPVTENMCLDIDASTCDELKKSDPHEACYSHCIGGINPLVYDKNKKILYFSAGSTRSGSSGAVYFVFSADLNSKKITFIKDDFDPDYASLSPTGKYLLTYGFNSTSIYNLETKEEVTLGEDNTRTHGFKRLYVTGQIKWLSDTRFSYTDAVKHSKFQDTNDEMKENVYDIPSKKIIQSRVMTKNEFNSAPYSGN